MTDLFVKYRIGGKEYRQGPYKTTQDAKAHHRDIAGFEGVCDCVIEDSTHVLDIIDFYKPGALKKGDLIVPTSPEGYVVAPGRRAGDSDFIRESGRDATATHDPVLVLSELSGDSWAVLTGGKPATLTALTAASIGFDRVASMDRSED